jgi:hypothetical protein
MALSFDGRSVLRIREADSMAGRARAGLAVGRDYRDSRKKVMGASPLLPALW